MFLTSSNVEVEGFDNSSLLEGLIKYRNVLAFWHEIANRGSIQSLEFSNL